MSNVYAMQEPDVATFEDWWERQLHKIGKPLCKVKWDAITSPEGYRTKMLDKTTGEYVSIHLKATPDELLEAQIRQNRAFYDRHGYGEKASAEKQFLRRPQQWLNQGGWMDE